MAKKVRSQTMVCPDCGQDLAGDPGYCLNCGTNNDSRASAPLVSRHQSSHTNDDMPDRASHLLWFDALLFTEWWYLPASLLLMAILPLLLLSGVLPVNYVSGLLAIAIVCVLALLLAWKMR